jgi:hypothetical protein
VLPEEGATVEENAVIDATVVVEPAAVTVVVLTELPGEEDRPWNPDDAAAPKTGPPQALLAPKGCVVGCGERPASCDEDNVPVTPMRTPAGTISISKTMATNAFLDRMSEMIDGGHDEGLSERSDKSIYDEKRVFTASS